MKTKLLFTVVAMACGLTSYVAQNVITLEGQYLGKNLFVKNTYGTGGVGYCITEIKVNGKTTRDKINADIFQINLAECGLKTGDKAKVEIICKAGCTPKTNPLVLNPAALESNGSLVLDGTFKWQNLYVSNSKGSEGVKEVLVNGKSVSAKTKSDFFEIDLMSLGLNDGDKIKVEFKYSKGNDPVIINPEAVN